MKLDMSLLRFRCSIDVGEAKTLANKLHLGRAISQSNVWALGVAPVLFLIPGFLDEIIAGALFLVLSTFFIILRRVFVAQREALEASLKGSLEKHQLTEEEFQVALRDLNTITVGR